MMRAVSDQGRVMECRLFRVCWRSPVTREHGMSGPMSRAQAEFLVRDESIGNPLRRFWIEPWMEVDADEDDADDTTRSARRVN